MSMGGSHELGICLNANDSNKLASIIDGWKAAALDLVLKSGHGEVEGHLSIFTEGDGWKDIIIENHTVTDHGSLLARSAELVEQTKPQFQSKADVVSRVHEHRWTVEVPRLESGAKAEEWFTDPVHEDGELNLKNNTRAIAIDSMPSRLRLPQWRSSFFTRSGLRFGSVRGSGEGRVRRFKSCPLHHYYAIMKSINLRKTG